MTWEQAEKTLWEEHKRLERRRWQLDRLWVVLTNEQARTDARLAVIEDLAHKHRIEDRRI